MMNHDWRPSLTKPGMCDCRKCGAIVSLLAPKHEGCQPKGALPGGPCNRTACQLPGADWWNASTCAWYCRSCALKINRACIDHGGVAICAPAPAPPRPMGATEEGE